MPFDASPSLFGPIEEQGMAEWSPDVGRGMKAQQQAGTHMRVVSLFAGIGSFETGFKRSGHQTLMPCECRRPAAALDELRAIYRETRSSTDR